MQRIENTHIRRLTPLVSPRTLKAEYPASEAAAETVVKGRGAVERILAGEDHRLLVVVGPCSVHDVESVREYAQRLKDLSTQVEDQFVLVMRAYFEKPRTTVGWKGLINDPNLDGSYDLERGLREARHLLLDLAEMGLPVATEVLDPIVPQHIADLISWAAIGARTTESQTHREMSSGLSMPIGFKNSTDGNLEVAVNAMLSASNGHHFLGIDEDGLSCILETTGNPWTHLILRGGTDGPNFDRLHVAEARSLLEKADLPVRIMVDCSHANSSKDHKRQPLVFEDVVAQVMDGGRGIVGMMLESHLHEGRQNVTCGREGLAYGVSITDACIGWEETEDLLRKSHARLSTRTVTA
ncbi:MAG: 3-deoxy-7-phosphoheptulonate synthase [Candidatus Hydrogenedentes bacterium]|nr:3-deoxy-7-phosphoheptulonate synthase [Candidatus Hydrogenedentota bacterium]